MIFSTGECYTMRELGPGLYEYVRGECEDIRALDGQLAACEEQARGGAVTVTPEGVHAFLLIWAVIAALDVAHRLYHSRRHR